MKFHLVSSRKWAKSFASHQYRRYLPISTYADLGSLNQVELIKGNLISLHSLLKQRANLFGAKLESAVPIHFFNDRVEEVSGTNMNFGPVL